MLTMDVHLPNDPIIVIGVGNSGTRLLVRVLERCGVFMGGTLAENEFAEPEIFYSYINGFTEIFRHQVPLPHDWRSLVNIQRDHVHQLCREDLPFVYRQAGYRSGQWGFKDPRTLFTLPLFLEIFPNAQVVHLIRHGVDVSERYARKIGGGEVDWKELTLGVERWRQMVEIGQEYANTTTYQEILYESLCMMESVSIKIITQLTENKGSHVRAVVAKLVKSNRIGKIQSDVVISKEAHSLLARLGYN